MCLSFRARTFLVKSQEKCGIIMKLSLLHTFWLRLTLRSTMCTRTGSLSHDDDVASSGCLRLELSLYQNLRSNQKLLRCPKRGSSADASQQHPDSMFRTMLLSQTWTARCECYTIHQHCWRVKGPRSLHVLGVVAGFQAFSGPPM